MKHFDVDEGQYAFVLAQTAIMNCRVAGMQAENQHRMACGNSIAYGASEFDAVEREFEPLIGAAAFDAQEA